LKLTPSEERQLESFAKIHTRYVVLNNKTTTEIEDIFKKKKGYSSLSTQRSRVVLLDKIMKIEFGSNWKSGNSTYTMLKDKKSQKSLFSF